jgi:hypothetical protein
LRYGATAAESAGLGVSALALLALVATLAWSLVRRRAHVLLDPDRTSWQHGDAEAAPAGWLLFGLAGLLLLKTAVVDPHTTLFRCVSITERVCGADVTVNVPFPGAPALRGYSVSSSQIAPGSELDLRLLWEPKGTIDRQLASFVHVRPSQEGQPGNPRSENGMWAQAERRTWDGLYSTELLPGKLYEDSYRLLLPMDIPEGDYFLEVGWYDVATGEQVDIPPEAVQPPLRVLWRSVLLPDLQVRRHEA